MAINGRSRNWKKVFHEQLEEDAVEDTWRRRHRPLMNSALDFAQSVTKTPIFGVVLCRKPTMMV
jgi:hypothetical protein